MNSKNTTRSTSKNKRNSFDITPEMCDIVCKALEDDDLDVIKDYIPDKVPVDYIINEYIVFI